MEIRFDQGLRYRYQVHIRLLMVSLLTRFHRSSLYLSV
jgi:hypothetical protein